jgi:hypothetical protein
VYVGTKLQLADELTKAVDGDTNQLKPLKLLYFQTENK